MRRLEERDAGRLFRSAGWQSKTVLALHRRVSDQILGLGVWTGCFLPLRCDGFPVELTDVAGLTGLAGLTGVAVPTGLAVISREPRSCPRLTPPPALSSRGGLAGLGGLTVSVKTSMGHALSSLGMDFPISFSIPFRSFASSMQQKLIATPPRPARPVLPIRCIYASGSLGRS